MKVIINVDSNNYNEVAEYTKLVADKIAQTYTSGFDGNNSWEAQTEAIND